MEATQSEAVLTIDQRESFERDGYLKFDPEVPSRVIEGVLADMEPKYLWQGQVRYEGGVVYQPGTVSPRIKNAWQISENVKAVATATKVLNLLRELFGRRPMPFQTLNFPKGTQQAIHSDAMHFVPAEPTYMCGVWLALEDIDMANGPLIYYPGSHRLPFARYEDVGFHADKSEFPDYARFIAARNEHYEQFVRDLIEQHGLEPEYGVLKKGQALIWSSNLLHGGAPHEDQERTRHSQVTHYLFEGSFAFHTPMRKEGDKEYWTEPEEIV
jgi:hypothetical protein